MTTASSRRPDEAFAARLDRARTSGSALLDLTDSDPARWGLGWDHAELEGLLEESRATGGQPELVRSRAREAVASYLAGRSVLVPPEHIQLTASIGMAQRLLVELLCRPGDEVLVASPSRAVVELPVATESVRVVTYALVYDGTWRIDRRSLEKAVTGRTRAILVGNPSQPTGAALSREDLAFVEDLCSQRGIAIVADEAFMDTLDGGASVIEVTRCAGFHLSGLSGVCGLLALGAEWVAGAGPDELVAPVLARLELAIEASGAAPGPALAAVPPLLARRERFLAELRTRLSRNRALLASAALGESSWTVERGAGGCWAVLRIGGAEDEESLCLRLLEDGVAVLPGFTQGLPRHGYLVVSRLPTPEVFLEALSLLDRRLRAPLFE